ncbi:MAG: hypothetical protein U9R02_10595 [Thermodesulfobacteriota bacterium]|nr:hypothetical protein [Thermodesulfobacteriota bacterium]
MVSLVWRLRPLRTEGRQSSPLATPWQGSRRVQASLRPGRQRSEIGGQKGKSKRLKAEGQMTEIKGQRSEKDGGRSSNNLAMS